MSEPHFLQEKRRHVTICTFDRCEKNNLMKSAKWDSDMEKRKLIFTGE